MLKDGKIFGKINIIDAVVVLFIILAIAGIALVKSGKFLTSSKVNQGTKQLQFDVLMKGVKLSRNSNILKIGDKSFITIRNVPYTKLEIIDVKKSNVLTSIPDPKNPLQAIAVTDYTNPYAFNFIVTLKDTAIITPDGPVIGGNKIKTGLSVEMEGYDYKVGGTVSDVKVMD